MKKTDKTKEQLLNELASLRQRLHELGYSEQESDQDSDPLFVSPQRFRSIVENVPDGIVIVDREGIVLYVNRTRLILKPEDLVGTNVFEYVKTEMVEAYRDTLNDVFETGKTIQVEIQDITGRVFDCRTAPFDLSDDVKSVIVILTDITARWRTEEQLRKINQRFRAIVENAPDRFLIIDRDGTISFSNYTLPGFDIGDIVGTSIFDHVKPEQVDIYRETTERVFQTGQPYRLEVESVNNRILDVHGAPLKKGDEIDQFLVIVNDITERKEADEILKQNKEHLEDLVRERTSNLEEANTALRILLKTADQLKVELEDTVAFNMKRFALPYFQELRKNIENERQRTYLDLLEMSLNQITKPFMNGTTVKYLTLTPVEIKVVNLIKHGKTSKEIASLLDVSTKTVSNHRYSIRSKLNLDRKVNLRSYLAQLEIS